MGKCSGKLGRFPFSFFPKGALTPHRPQAGGGSPVGARALISALSAGLRPVALRNASLRLGVRGGTAPAGGRKTKDEGR
jgi:hypothetical protein